MKTRILAPLLTLPLMFACGGDDDHNHGEEDVAAELCEHAKDGPFQTVTAGADAAGAASASFEHTSVTVTLTDYMSQKGGCVSVDVEAEGELILAVNDAAVSMALSDASGTAIAAEKTETITDCTELARMDTFDVAAGTHTICFGPTALTELRFGFEEGGAHDHEE